MKNFYATCFAADDQSARIGGLKLTLTTRSLSDRVPLSRDFAEGVLMFVCACVRSFGYVSDSGETVFAASWQIPGEPLYWGSIDLTAGKYETNAPPIPAKAGLGLLGMGAALHARSEGFQTAWLEFLQDSSVRGAAAVNDENIGRLAEEVGRALLPHSWEMNGSTLLEPPLVDDLRSYYVNGTDFVQLMNSFAAPVEYESRFQGPQLRLLRGMLQRRKHSVLIGPPGTGKTISAFEALAAEGFTRPGVDFQLFTGHDEVKSADFLGAWQPSGDPNAPFVWVNAALVRAMTANNGLGQPMLVEEWTRMPTRAQNMFISALSDGYVVLNEKPSADGVGEVVRAGPNFVLIADMNADPAADDLDLYGAAFGSRVRKLEYAYPSTASLIQILEHDVPGIDPIIQTGIAGTYDAVMKRWEAAELNAPISPRACVQWAEETLAELAYLGKRDSVALRTAAIQGAELTWLRDVAGVDDKTRKTVVADVEAQFRKAVQMLKKAA
jgi:MoxR-like ATPase